MTSHFLFLMLGFPLANDGPKLDTAVPATVRADYEQLAKRTSADAAGHIGLGFGARGTGSRPSDRNTSIERSRSSPRTPLRMAFWATSTRVKDGSPPISLRRSRSRIANDRL